MHSVGRLAAGRPPEAAACMPPCDSKSAYFCPLYCLLQLYPRIEFGERPPVPPKDQLPGQDTSGVAGLDAYTALMM